MRTQKETDLQAQVVELQARVEELQARVEELEDVVNGGEYDDPYGVWDRVCQYQTAAAEQEGET